MGYTTVILTGALAALAAIQPLVHEPYSSLLVALIAGVGAYIHLKAPVPVGK